MDTIKIKVTPFENDPDSIWYVTVTGDPTGDQYRAYDGAEVVVRHRGYHGEEREVEHWWALGSQLRNPVGRGAYWRWGRAVTNAVERAILDAIRDRV